MSSEIRAEIHRLSMLWQELEELHRPAKADELLRRIERLAGGA